MVIVAFHLLPVLTGSVVWSVVEVNVGLAVSSLSFEQGCAKSLHPETILGAVRLKGRTFICLVGM